MILRNVTTGDEPHYLGHRKRLRDRFESAGREALADYELLELLLGYAIPRKDVKPLAKALIRHFGSLSAVMDAPPRDLATVDGLSSVSCTLIGLAKALCEQYMLEGMKDRDVLSSPQAVLQYARAALAGLPHESFMVIFLNAKNEVLEHKIIHEGTVDKAVIYPRRVVEGALGCHAAGLILVHNHPSGHADPSEEDRRLTRSISEATRTLDIRIVDHVVVGKRGSFSFAEQNLL